MYSNVLKCIQMYSNVFLENRNAVIKKAELLRDGMMSCLEESNVFKCIFRKKRNAVIKKAGWLRDGMMAWSYQRAGSIIDTR